VTSACSATRHLPNAAILSSVSTAAAEALKSGTMGARRRRGEESGEGLIPSPVWESLRAIVAAGY